jgi:hypothetical protein
MQIQHIATILNYPSALQPGTYVWKDSSGLIVNIGKTTKTVLHRNLQQDKRHVHHIVSRRGNTSDLYLVGPSSCENVMIGVFTILNGHIPLGQKHPGRPIGDPVDQLPTNRGAIILKLPDLRNFWPIVESSFTIERHRFRPMFDAVCRLKNRHTGIERIRALYSTTTGKIIGCEKSSTLTGTHNWQPLLLP